MLPINQVSQLSKLLWTLQIWGATMHSFNIFKPILMIWPTTAAPLSRQTQFTLSDSREGTATFILLSRRLASQYQRIWILMEIGRQRLAIWRNKSDTYMASQRSSTSCSFRILLVSVGTTNKTSYMSSASLPTIRTERFEIITCIFC